MAGPRTVDLQAELAVAPLGHDRGLTAEAKQGTVAVRRGRRPFALPGQPAAGGRVHVEQRRAFQRHLRTAVVGKLH